jgi:hypothetical protein
MFEKIDFQGLICQQSLELSDLLAQDQFAGPYRGRVCLVHSVAPVVKYPAAYWELFCEPDIAAARIHSLDSLPPKLITVPLPFFSFHFTAPFPQSVHHKTISLYGFTPPLTGFSKLYSAGDKRMA